MGMNPSGAGGVSQLGTDCRGREVTQETVLGQPQRPSRPRVVAALSLP